MGCAQGKATVDSRQNQNVRLHLVNESAPAGTRVVAKSASASKPTQDTYKVLLGSLRAASSAKSRFADQVASGRHLIHNGRWILEVLDVHNRLRAIHGCPPLEWDANCARRAQQAADACASRGCMYHNNCKEHGHGQNIFFGTPGHFGAADAIQAWYNEVDDPGYHCPAAPGTGHFTQLVWLATTHVGMSCDSKGKGYMVANYSPPGNMQPADPHYIRNVLPRGSRMQKRPKLCTVAKTIVATSMTAEVREVLNSTPSESIKAEAANHLARGGKAEFVFKPPPQGSLTVKLFVSRGSRTLTANW